MRRLLMTPRLVPALVLPLLLPLLLVACEGGTETRTFALQYLHPDEAHSMIEPYVPGGGENMRITRQPASLTITAPEVRLEQIAGVLGEYDRARPDVRLRFQIIEADGFTEADAAIADVEQALRELFRFSGYRLIGEAVVQAKAPGHVEQNLGDTLGYSITAALHRVVSADNAHAVELSVDLRAAGHGTLISTSLTVPSGQTVVVGSARAGTDSGTVILVVRPVIG